ncbi:MAG: CRTAC1 family protein [Acidobacteria bacterium]|nr:MAG: CRTAC1 family protein [Acidobacteriota bacterium]
MRHLPLLLLLAPASILPAVDAAAATTLGFREVAADWGLAVRHHHGGSGRYYMVETIAGGVIAFDYDGDGDADLLFTDGAPLPGYRGEKPRTRLLRNDGGRFVDRTEEAGITFDGYGAGGTAGDVDGDGDLDLYLTAFGANVLLLNRGDGTFVDRTEEAGVGDPLWSMSAAFADFDRDGDLDLYVTNYVDFSLDNNVDCSDKATGIEAYCPPDVYNPLPDRYYENLGPGPGGVVRFADATARVGLDGAVGNGLGVVVGDLDDDGWPDVYVANDLTPNFLFRNRGRVDGGGIRFEDLSLLSGTGYSPKGRPEAGMGVAMGDYDADGDLDLTVTNFELESNGLYANMAGGVFIDNRFTAGLAEPSLLVLGFGVAFADLDLDGDLDLVVANGHINDNAEQLGSPTPHKQPNHVFENLGNGRFRKLPDDTLSEVRASRGLALADLDLDGDLDLVFVNSNDHAEVYENLTAGGHWLQVVPRARHGDRFAVGTRTVLETGDRRQLRELRTATSFLSQDELVLAFGLGPRTRADALRLRWPRGGVTLYRHLPADRRLVVIGD